MFVSWSPIYTSQSTIDLSRQCQGQNFISSCFADLLIQGIDKALAVDLHGVFDRRQHEISPVVVYNGTLEGHDD
jgi:hypothetical protein